MDNLTHQNLKEAIIAVLQDYVEFLGDDPECITQLTMKTSIIFES